MSSDSVECEKSSGRRSFLAKALGLAAGTSLLGGAVKAFAKAGGDQSSLSGGVPKQVDFANPALGQVIMFAGNYAPTGWAICDGSLMSISQNTALFSILGTTYGGDGKTTFGLPDLRGRVPIGTGQGAGLTNRLLGEMSGEESHTLAVGELPSHTHPAVVDNSAGTSDTPVNNVPAVNSEGIQHYGTAMNAAMNAGAIGNTGGSQAHNNMQPYLGMTYLIALVGIFPARS
jgi:microcystin-dependent protein